MKLGLFPNMPEAEYRALAAVNSSALKQGRRSIAHMRHAMVTPSSPTPAMELGTALHMALLEPARFDKTYAFCTWDVDKRAKEWKSHATWCEEHGLIAMTKDDGAALGRMVAQVMAHPEAAAMLKGAGECEYVAVWQDPGTGLACKARLDKYVPGALALDIKTTRNAEPEQFARQMYDLGYWQQLAWYHEGFMRASGIDTPFTIIAVENEAPYCVSVFTLGDDTLARGVAENHAILKKYAEALRAGVFPGYPTGVHELNIPDWAMKRHIPEAAYAGGADDHIF